MKLFGKLVNRSNWKHFAAGLLIGMTGFCFSIILFDFLHRKSIQNVEFSFSTLMLFTLSGTLLSFLIGLGKEVVWDKWLKKGTYEFNDIVFTTAGGLTMSLFNILLYLI